MAIEQAYGFYGSEQRLIFFNRQAVLNLAIEFLYSDDSSFDFPGFSSAYLIVYDERSGTTIKSFASQVTRNSDNLVLNLSESDMTFDDEGKYYFELGYIKSGGYEQVLRYGEFKVI